MVLIYALNFGVLDVFFVSIFGIIFCGRFLGVSDTLFVYQLDRFDYLRFMSPDNHFKSRKYQGDFKIIENGGSIKILNDILVHHKEIRKNVSSNFKGPKCF